LSGGSTMSKAKKVFTAHQVARLAPKGYYLSYTPDRNHWIEVMYIGDGGCNWCRWTDYLACPKDEWVTLTWSCAPTKKGVAEAAKKGEPYLYAIRNKAPNDI
jgi:hypothetical protein